LRRPLRRRSSVPERGMNHFEHKSGQGAKFYVRGSFLIR